MRNVRILDNGKKVVISCQIPVALHELLLKVAADMGVSKSDVIRILLERGLNADK